MKKYMYSFKGLICLALISLPGCIQFSLFNKGTERPSDYWTLKKTLPQPVLAYKKPLPFQVLIEMPSGSNIYNGRNIIYFYKDNAIWKQDKVADHYWALALPALIQAEIKNSLLEKNCLQGVGFPQDTLLPDFFMGIDLLAFQLERDQNPAIHLHLYVKLIRLPGRRVTFGKSFQVIQPLKNWDATTIYQGFNQAFDKMRQDITQWTIDQLREYVPQ